MGVLRSVGGLLAIALLAGWNRFVTGLAGSRDADTPGRTPEAERDARDADPAAGDGVADGRGPAGGRSITEHRRNWYDYLRGFHVHHGKVDADGDCPEYGSFWQGLDCWLDSRCLRGYTIGDHTYVCSNAPRVLRVHQAGHTPSFGRQLEPIHTERRDDGGLADEPLSTFDVMLPGDFPHTLLRLRDPRGLGETYDRWFREGRIERV